MDLRAATHQIFDELISQGDLSLVETLIADDYVDPRGPRGRAGFVGGLAYVREAFPDWSSTIEEMLVDGDVVAARWTVRGTHRGEFMGIPATGRTIAMQECGFLSFREGQLVEIRRVADELTLMKQLGVVEVAS